MTCAWTQIAGAGPLSLVALIGAEGVAQHPARLLRHQNGALAILQELAQLLIAVLQAALPEKIRPPLPMNPAYLLQQFSQPGNV